jgi:hypothetical protein
MELPLELITRSGTLFVEPTTDYSRTRLRAGLGGTQGLRALELDVRDVQALAGALLQWLAECGHDLPELPVQHPMQYPDGDEDIDEDPDQEVDSRPPAQFGVLKVIRTGLMADGIRIEKADPWVLASGELLHQLKVEDSWVTVDGLNMTIADSEGTVVRYLARPDVACDAGVVVLQKLSGHGPMPDVSALPKYRR